MLVWRFPVNSGLTTFLKSRYQGQIGAALILGGVDINGPHLYTIYPHGSTDKLPYVTMGSGSLAAMSVFESRFVADMNVSLICKIETRLHESIVFRRIAADLYI